MAIDRLRERQFFLKKFDKTLLKSVLGDVADLKRSYFKT